ncbi:hypothetical protein ACRAWG_15710 [Methylobacterium sp. P31]
MSLHRRLDRLSLTLMVRRCAIIGSTVLYALLLQAFQGFAAPALALGGPGTVLCGEHQSDAPAGKAAHLHSHAR